MNHGERFIPGSSTIGSRRGDARKGEPMSHVEGSILISPPRGPCRGDGFGGDGLGTHGEGFIRPFPPLGSDRGSFGESETTVVFSGFLDGSWAGHKLSAVFGNSFLDSGRIGLGDEVSGVVGGCREGSGQGDSVWAFGILSKQLSSRRGHCSPRSDSEGGVSGLEELSGGILGLS